MVADYYETLGVSRDASADELQQAYRDLARYHPDVNRSPTAEERGPGSRAGDQRRGGVHIRPAA